MPDLIIIAGCNGAGKSTFASSFLPEGLTSFDYDKVYLEYYYSLPDSELREQFSKNKTSDDFERAIERALLKQTDFCYETNFDSHPIYWPQRFKENGYQISLIFFCLENQEIAKHRIQVRKEFKGHFVNDRTIDSKWKAGYANLNTYFRFFDNILIVDNSKQNEVYTNILQIEKGRVFLMCETVPDYFCTRLPDVYDFIMNHRSIE
ncbi:MAG TPA: zeta toxin family protein [Bacteroidales bacterium]|nr:zeta toxin family protein [Bacteroidales bacterium]